MINYILCSYSFGFSDFAAQFKPTKPGHDDVERMIGVIIAHLFGKFAQTEAMVQHQARGKETVGSTSDREIEQLGVDRAKQPLLHALIDQPGVGVGDRTQIIVGDLARDLWRGIAHQALVLGELEVELERVFPAEAGFGLGGCEHGVSPGGM